MSLVKNVRGNIVHSFPNPLFAVKLTLHMQGVVCVLCSSELWSLEGGLWQGSPLLCRNELVSGEGNLLRLEPASSTLA